MSLSKLNENLNNHQSLPDQPALTSDELKILFDKASNDIKDYINNILTTEIDSLITQIQNGKIDVTKIVNDLTTGGANKVASAEMVKQLNTDKLGSNSTAVSANKLATARTISVTGAMQGSATFDGSANAMVNVTQKIDEYDLYSYRNSTYIENSRFFYRKNLQKCGKLVNISCDCTFTAFSISSYSWITAFTLPTALRPDKNIPFTCWVSNSTRQGYISTDGKVYIRVYPADDSANLVFNFSYYTN